MGTKHQKYCDFSTFFGQNLFFYCLCFLPLFYLIDQAWQIQGLSLSTASPVKYCLSVPESIEDHEVEQDADEGADHVTSYHHHPVHHPLGAVPHLGLSALIAPEVEAEDKIIARERYFSQFYSLKLTLN